MLKRIISILLYAGVSRSEYEEIFYDCNKANRQMVNILSGFATVLIAAMYVSTYYVAGVAMNRPIYLIGAIISLTLFLVSMTLSKKHPLLVDPAVYLAYSIFFSYGILIGTVTSPDEKTVTFMVLLVFLPVIFVSRPLQQFMMTAAFVFIFIGLCLERKTGDILSNDIIDAIIFGLLGCACSTVINCIKAKSYLNARRVLAGKKELEEANKKLDATVQALAESNQALEAANATLKKVSRGDQATGMQNRNAYEMDRYTYPERCKNTLACVFIDVNGLKAVNDEFGHEAGDKMLRVVAEQIHLTFGKKNSYRIGGDEFVVLIPDIDREALQKKVEDLEKRVESQGYYIAVGLDVQEKDSLSLTSLTKTAEAMMYQAKSVFYKNSDFDRRKR